MHAYSIESCRGEILDADRKDGKAVEAEREERLVKYCRIELEGFVTEQKKIQKWSVFTVAQSQGSPADPKLPNQEGLAHQKSERRQPGE